MILWWQLFCFCLWKIFYCLLCFVIAYENSAGLIASLKLFYLLFSTSFKNLPFKFKILSFSTMCPGRISFSFFWFQFNWISWLSKFMFFSVLKNSPILLNKYDLFKYFLFPLFSNLSFWKLQLKFVLDCLIISFVFLNLLIWVTSSWLSSWILCLYLICYLIAPFNFKFNYIFHF